MNTQRVTELCTEANDLAAGFRELLDEFTTANAHGGAGVHRDPSIVFRELYDEARDLVSALRDQRDELEREARG